jgi:hypothetical protein
MWRTIACAAGGLVLAGAAVYSLNAAQSAGGLDLSFLYQQRSPAKSDRLSMPEIAPAGGFAVSFNLPSQNTTVVAKSPALQPVVKVITTLRIPRDPVPVQSVRENNRPEQTARKPKLPEGCEPSFSPVTVPSLAHVASRCTS